MKNKIKSQKGFAASDGLIAVLIIALFAGLIATVSYNIYLANSSIKRMSKATNYIVDMFEYIDKVYYDDVTAENLANYFNNKYYYEDDGITVKEDSQVKIKEQETETLSVPFEGVVNIVKYNEQEGNEDKIDLVKEITMQVNYKVGNKNQTIEMKKIKQRENLEIPNKPDLSKLELQEGENVYPIKNIGEEWIVCELNDNNWYNYENGNWAILLKTQNNLAVNDKIDIDNLEENETIYAWIPRFAYDETNNTILFLFSNSNRFVENLEEYNTLRQIDETLYTIPDDFMQSEGIWTDDTTLEVYQILNTIYPLNS